MTLAPGTRLGVYEVTAHIGEGGMGQVFRATDTKLKRQVAIKILPHAVAADHDRLARFQREAEVLASLNHPHIAGIYGLEESNGVTAIVMELIEGEDLSQRVARGRLPIDEALAIAKQITEALAAAHEQGIIHRDLKPANIKVRDDGTVKVLDFGLAKIAESATGGLSAGPGHSQSPTITTPAMTAAGMILGTAAYMSPEQAKGKTADRRTDVWALGCVMYEMLTGTRAFGGDDISETFAAVLRGEPDFSALPDDLPPIVRAALAKCFQKNPAARLADVTPIKFAIEHPAVVLVARTRKGMAWPGAIAASLVLAALGFGLAWWLRRPVEPARPIIRSAILLGRGEQFTAPSSHVMALSPDGRRLAYVADYKLMLRELDSLEAKVLLEGLIARGLREPFFSPDGAWVGFWIGNVLRRVSVQGGAAVTICDQPPCGSEPSSMPDASINVTGTSWNDNDTIMFGGRSIWRVSTSGGAPAQIVTDVKGTARSPHLLPSGEVVLFTLIPDSDRQRTDVVAHSLRTGERTIVVPGGSDTTYLDGFLVYYSDTTVFAVPFDVRALKVTGPPTPILSDVGRGPLDLASVSQFGMSRDGTFLHLPVRQGVGTGRQQLVLVDRAQRESPLQVPPRAYMYPRFSPDGTNLALHIQEDSLDLYSLHVQRGTLTRLTTAAGRDFYPVWRDNRRVLFAAGVPANVWQVDVAAGSSPERVAKTTAEAQLPGSLVPGGTGLLMTIGATSDLKLLSLTPPYDVTTVLESPTLYRNPEVSPDGRWLAYQAADAGEFEIEVRPFPEVKTARYQVSTGGGSQPAWSPTGDELFYVAAGGGIMSVPRPKGDDWNASSPRKILDGAYTWSLPGSSGRFYDVAPDGQHFVILKPLASEQSDQLSLVLTQNAFSLLRRSAAPR